MQIKTKIEQIRLITASIAECMLSMVQGFAIIAAKIYEVMILIAMVIGFASHFDNHTYPRVSVFAVILDKTVL